MIVGRRLAAFPIYNDLSGLVLDLDTALTDRKEIAAGLISPALLADAAVDHELPHRLQ